MNNELAVVMPVYNEEEIVAEVVNEWTKELEKLSISFHIHAYDDGSKDNSLRILQELKKNNPRLVVHTKQNSGHGPTLTLGYKENADCAWIFQTDSDNEMPATEFHKIWDLREENDFVLGKRNEREQTRSRYLLSLVSRLVVWIFYGKTVYDVNSPFRLMRCEKFRKLFTNLSSATLTPNLIISGFVSQGKLRYAEIPVEHKGRRTGKATASKRILKLAFKAIGQVIHFRFVYAR